MMVKLKDYESLKSDLLRIYDKRGLDKAIEAAVGTGCNLVAFYSFLNEHDPNPHYEQKIKDLIEFYQYKGVIK
jgi:hypothetical protein